MISGATLTPWPPNEAYESKAVGRVGSGNSQAKPRYWPLELLMRACGLKFWANWLPFGAAQFASSWDRGAAAKGAGVLFAASTVGTDIEEARKRSVMDIEVSVVFVETFVIIFDLRSNCSYLDISRLPMLYD